MINVKFQNTRGYYLSGNPILIGIVGKRYRIYKIADSTALTQDIIGIYDNAHIPDGSYANQNWDTAKSMFYYNTTTKQLYVSSNPSWNAMGVPNTSTRYYNHSDAQYYVWNGQDLVLYNINDDTILYEGVCEYNSDFFQVDLNHLFDGILETKSIIYAKIMIVNDNSTESGISNKQDTTTSFVVFKGGVSKQMMRNLAVLNSDIFTEKLKNNNTNFLLTTRTNSNYVFIPENELLPLKYYGTGMKYDVKADGAVLFSIDHTAETEEKLFSIDLSLLRKQVATNSGKLISEFRFTKNDDFLFTVLLTEPLSFTKYALDFINSWGARERVAIHKDIDYIPESEDKEKYQKWDTVISDFTRQDERKKFTHKYSANLGIRNSSDTLFLQDLFQSDQVWLIVENKYEFPVFIKPDANLIATTKGTPVEVTATLELKDKDENYCPLLTDDGVLYLTSESINVTSQQSNIVV